MLVWTDSAHVGESSNAAKGFGSRLRGVALVAAMIMINDSLRPSALGLHFVKLAVS